MTISPSCARSSKRTIGAQTAAARSAVYLWADICRADLLVEVEAHGFARGGARMRRPLPVAIGLMTRVDPRVRCRRERARPRRQAGARRSARCGRSASVSPRCAFPTTAAPTKAVGTCCRCPTSSYRGKFLKADREGARAVLVDVERFEVEMSVSASVPTRSRRQRRAQRHARSAGQLRGRPETQRLAVARARSWHEARVAHAGARGRHRRELAALGRHDLRAEPQPRRGARTPGTSACMAGPLFGDRRRHARHLRCRPGVRDARATGVSRERRLRRLARHWHRPRAASKTPGSVPSCVTTTCAARCSPTVPLVRRDHAFTVGVGVAWVFASSSVLVDADD